MKKVVNYKVEKEDWKKAQDEAFNKLNKKAKIDGFRPGKAPRNVFEKHYGKQEIIYEAADKLINDKFHELLSDDKLIPVVEPKIEPVKLDEESLEVNFTIITEPEVTLGEYKNLGIKKDEVKVTKKEIEHEIEHILERYAEISTKEGNVEKGDIAIIDFEGFKDGVAFDGGKAENYELEIGSNSFIPGFEDGIIGMSKGEEKDLNLTFPKDYASEELKGQKVVFKVKVNEIKERIIPKLDKDFFEDLSMPGISTKEDLEKEVESQIKAHKDMHAENEYVDKLLEKAASNMKIEIEEEMLDAEQEGMYSDLLEKLKMQGLTEEIYLQYANTTKEKIKEQMKEEAEKRIKYRYLLKAIIKAEKLKVTDKQVEKEIDDMAKQYNVSKEEILKEIKNIEYVKQDMLMRKALEVIKG